MDPMDFIAKTDVVELIIEGHIFKYKPANAGDELNWLKDYSSYEEKEIDGEKKIVYVQDDAKLSLCKLRNVISVPFTREQLNTICGINKEFKNFNSTEKDLFFEKFKGPIYNKLIKSLDGNNQAKKE
jgi:hypothetical protein